MPAISAPRPPTPCLVIGSHVNTLAPIYSPFVTPQDLERSMKSIEGEQSQLDKTLDQLEEQL